MKDNREMKRVKMGVKWPVFNKDKASKQITEKKTKKKVRE